MRQSIFTKYICPTNHHGSRISVASSSGIRKMYDWDYSLNVEPNHYNAALQFAKHMQWNGKWHGGATKDGYVFVCECVNFVI